ncbi:ATP-dependent helicase [Methylocaldum marinum]|uniref:ATP-dependent helicase n=1 Tax=Methylocaldum marinum TaxID=1432792 RepID=A0A250KZH6_9GAMM|nr:ATP-dependent helicase [Methylocaldum marinum]
MGASLHLGAARWYRQDSDDSSTALESMGVYTSPILVTLARQFTSASSGFGAFLREAALSNKPLQGSVSKSQFLGSFLAPKEDST